MIEPIMFVGIGFLVASMLVIGLIPLVHARAVRLTMKRLEAATPISMAEIQADKDLLRAEFAMSTRRLEMSVDQLKAKATSQLAEIGKKSEAIGRLKLELGEKTASLFTLEAKEKQLTDELRATEQELTARVSTLEETQKTLTDTHRQLAEATAKFHEASLTSDSQRVELVALLAQVELYKGRIENFEKETKDLTERLDLKTQEAEATQRLLSDERARTETLGERINELERQLVAETTESEILGRRVQELLVCVDEQNRFLAEREFASDQLRQEATVAQKAAADIRAELAETENRRKVMTENMRAEKALVEDQLRQSQDERAKLQREIENMRREAEAAWASERLENAVMRERINDVAAELARLTSVLEGPGNPIDAILAGDTALTANGSNGHAPPLAPGDGKGTLADRVRALQSLASRVPQPSSV
jgi:DNA repair exonuclease SbcCD ATPase subunit